MELGHRKNILADLKARNVEANKAQLEEVLRNCITCLEIDGKYINSSRYVETTYPGEIVGIDLMLYKNQYIIVIIDYQYFFKTYHNS